MLSATLEGQGVGISSDVFAANELKSGRLVRVFDAEVSATFGIYAVCLPRRLNDPLISGTMDWLVREAQASPDAHPPAP
jgi:LysR family glycine cleavage system transcriptional activator